MGYYPTFGQKKTLFLGSKISISIFDFRLPIFDLSIENRKSEIRTNQAMYALCKGIWAIRRVPWPGTVANTSSMHLLYDILPE
jgi:hypothetical protein